LRTSSEKLSDQTLSLARKLRLESELNLDLIQKLYSDLEIVEKCISSLNSDEFKERKDFMLKKYEEIKKLINEYVLEKI
jgi:hypothetical protein